MSRSQPRPPSIEAILVLLRPTLEPGTAAGPITDLVRDVVSLERERIGAGERPRSSDALCAEARARLDALVTPSGSGLVSVINGTGVIVHTNLGRSAWPLAAIEAAARAAGEPALLELDRDSGRRGRRYRAAEQHLIALSGAEDALITNNNAAALALAVGLARRKGVAVSRGELVEIGGGVRIPDIVRRSGARLVEVGTTNRTRASDFEEPLVEGRASIDPEGAPLQLSPGRFRGDARSGGARRARPGPRGPARG